MTLERERQQGLQLNRLRRPAWLYLVHVALLTSSLAVTSLFFNLTILALGFERSFLGLLNVASVATAGIFSLPLWWLATRVGLRQALIVSAGLQALSALSIALWPNALPLLAATAGTGVAAVLFQVTAAPFMMRQSDDATRDTLFSLNAALNVGLAGVGSLLGGYLPGLLGALLGQPAESVEAYRATFGLAAAGLALSILPLLLINTERSAQSAEQTGLAAPSADQLALSAEQTKIAPSSPAGPPALAVAEATRSAVPSWLRDHNAAGSKLHIGWFDSWLQRLPEPWQGMARHPWPLLQLLIPPALISLGAALLIPYLNLFFKERFGSPDSTLGAIFAGLGVANGLAALAAPLLSARLGKPRTIALTQLLSIPFLLALGFVPLLGAAVVAALMRGALFNLGSPLYDAFAMERSQPDARPTVIGLINAAYAGGYLVAPPISVYVQEHYGFGPLFVATAGCYAGAVLATYWFFVRGTTPDLSRADSR